MGQFLPRVLEPTPGSSYSRLGSDAALSRVSSVELACGLGEPFLRITRVDAVADKLILARLAPASYRPKLIAEPRARLSNAAIQSPRLGLSAAVLLC